MTGYDTYNQAMEQCAATNSGFTTSQCSQYAQCVQFAVDFAEPIQLCGIDQYGVVQCGVGDGPGFIPTDYQTASAQCYMSFDSPPLGPPPEEVPPYDPYADCMNECQKSNKMCVLLY